MGETDDRLDFENNAKIKGVIGDENIIFSDTITKIAIDKLFGKNQERKFLITNLAIYNIKGDEIKRRIRIDDLKGITVSKTSGQFIIHCNKNEYDYLYVSKSRKKIIKALQTLYEALTSKDLLFCQKNEKELKQYVVGKKERRKSINLFKIDQSELTSIKDYLENDASDIIQEEPEPEKKKKEKKTKVKEADSDVKVIASKGKGVPPPPPPPPPPPVVATIAPSKPAPSKPVDLEAELAAKKSNLSHVEVKEYVSPALQNPEEGGGVPQTSNSMMAAIIAKRNQMKKIGGAGGGGGAATGAPKPSGMSTSSQAPKPMGGASKPPTSNTATAMPGRPKPPTSSVASKPPASGTFKPPTSSAASKPPASSTASKPPMKTGGGGGNAFAAKMAALQARMGGMGGGGGGGHSTAATSSSHQPSDKPIVELCEGNTKRMDINKVIGNLEKEKKKQTKSSSKPVEVKVVAGKGKGIPPPPPPPPPPPKI